jgi:hypothetical protein
VRINERLNIVIPLYHDDEPYAYVHSTPISREVFEVNYLLISKTFSSIHSEGLGEVAGPRVAQLIMRDIAEQGGDRTQKSARSLLDEIGRLSNVILAGKSGWETIPLQEALDRKLIDEDDRSEVMNSLVFFTVASLMYPRNMRQMFMDRAAQIWGARMLSSNSTDFTASLPTSTATVSSGETAAPRPVPPAAGATLIVTDQTGARVTSSLPV